MLPTRTPDSHMRRNPDCHVTLPNFYLQTIVPPHFYNDLSLLYVNQSHRRLERSYQVPVHPPVQRTVHKPIQNDDSTDLYPAHFRKGSIIELADGSLTRVEDLKEEDLRKSAELSNEFHLDTSTLLKIERVHQSNVIQLIFGVGKSMIEVNVLAAVEHPFFVLKKGWSSFDPQATLRRYGLLCDGLNIGDVCISLRPKDDSLEEATVDVVGDNPA